MYPLHEKETWNQVKSGDEDWKLHLTVIKGRKSTTTRRHKAETLKFSVFTEHGSSLHSTNEAHPEMQIISLAGTSGVTFLKIFLYKRIHNAHKPPG